VSCEFARFGRFHAENLQTQKVSRSIQTHKLNNKLSNLTHGPNRFVIAKKRFSEPLGDDKKSRVISQSASRQKVYMSSLVSASRESLCTRNRCIVERKTKRKVVRRGHGFRAKDLTLRVSDLG